MLKMNAAELDAFLLQAFPDKSNFRTTVEVVEKKRLAMRLYYSDLHLRPGGTISGPTMMTLADTAVYLLVIAHIGPVPLAVTTSLNINFLRKPEPVDLIADSKLLKLGSRLAVGEVSLYSAGDEEAVAHATVTYSIPPEKYR